VRGVAAAVAAGALLAVQARLNGELTARTGSAELVTLISFLEGTVLLGVLVAARGGSQLRAVLRGRRPWWLAAGPLGAFLIVAISTGVPRLGVATVTVLTVVGQTVAGVILDARGHGGRRVPVSGRRIGAVALAVLALGAAAGGAHPAGTTAAAVAGLAVVLVLAGVASSLQQAANGVVARRTGDPAVAALASFASGAALLAVAVAAVALLAPEHIHGPWPGAGEAWLYAGGLAGTVFVAVTAWVVRRVGVLTVALASVGGQLVGALGLDLLAGSRTVDLASVVASLAVLASVALAGMPPQRRGLRRIASVPLRASS
jgi:bacterial/archaeal transporter family-2 protein